MRKLFGVVLVLGLAGQIAGQGPAPSPPGPPGSEAVDPGPEKRIVIATTNSSSKREPPSDTRLPTPDDGLRLRSVSSNPGTTAPPPRHGEGVHQALYREDSAPPAPPVGPTFQPDATPKNQPGKPELPGAKGAGDPPGAVEPASPGQPRRLSPGQGPGEPADKAEPRPAGSALSLEMVGPDRAQPGQVYPCMVVVRNTGGQALEDVLVELPLPRGARPMLPPPVSSKPLDQLDPILKWKIAALPSGGERRLTADFQLTEAGEVHLRPRATFHAAPGLRPTVVKPAFSVEVSGPARALPGEKVTLTVRVGNNGSEPLRQVHIRCKLGPGLHHVQGETVATDIPGLAPGEQRALQLVAEARAAGGQQLQVWGNADGRLTASASTVVVVSDHALTARIGGPRDARPGAVLTFQVEVHNPGRATAGGVRLRQVLPRGLEFVLAEGASWDQGSQTISWSLPDLLAGRRHLVSFQVRAREVGDWALLPAVLAEGVGSTTVPHAVHVEAVPTLVVEAAVEDVLGPGAETTCEVRIANQAATAAHAVRLVVHLPANLAILRADGPTRAQAQGQLLLFDPLAQLAGRAVAVYQLRLRGLRPGAGLFRVEVQAGGMDRPVQRELTTHVRETALAGQPGG